MRRAFKNNLQTNLPFIYLLAPIRAYESRRYVAFFEYFAKTEIDLLATIPNHVFTSEYH